MTLHAHIVVHRDHFDLDVSLDVSDGETLALLGINGAGKTTALRALAGLTALDDGYVAIDDMVVDDGRSTYLPPERRSVGMVFQHYALFPHLSVADNIAFGLRTRRGETTDVDDKVAAEAERFDLSDLIDRKPHQLSGGQSQRVALARTLITQPRLLLLDEPVAALDVGARTEARRDLHRHLARFSGMSVLVTHDPLDVYALADRVAIIEEGSIVQAGTVAEVTARPRSRFVADLVGTNLVYGEVSSAGLRTESGTLLPVVADFTGPGWASIRPQSITVVPHRSKGSARISVVGTVEEMATLGERVRVTIGGAVPLIAEITTASASELHLRVGSPCLAQIKATDVSVYPD